MHRIARGFGASRKQRFEVRVKTHTPKIVRPFLSIQYRETTSKELTGFEKPSLSELLRIEHVESRYLKDHGT